MFKFSQFDIYDEAKKFLLYAEKNSDRHIKPQDELLAHKIKSSLVTVVANIARASSEEDERKKHLFDEAKGLLHEIAAGFDIVHDKRLITDETFDKIQEKIKQLLKSLDKI